MELTSTVLLPSDIRGRSEHWGGSVKRSLAMAICKRPRTIGKAFGLDAATRSLRRG